MTSFKTTKIVDKLIADGWKLEIVPVQHMFPNCNIRYKTKCTDMKDCDVDKMFWDSIERKLKQLKEAEMSPENQPFRTKRVIQKTRLLDKLRKIIGLREKGLKPPKGFKGW